MWCIRTRVYVIEVNPRSSRTVPYISKVTGVPMVELATRCMLGEPLSLTGLRHRPVSGKTDYVAVKVPVFSFEKLRDLDIQLGPEMKSTGEVLGLSNTFEKRFAQGTGGRGLQDEEDRAACSSPFGIPTSRRPWRLRTDFVSLGFDLYATAGTANRLNTRDDPRFRGAQDARGASQHRGSAGKRQDRLHPYPPTPTAGIPRLASVQMRRLAVERAIPVFTSVDTAKAMLRCLSMDQTMDDVELVDITKL